LTTQELPSTQALALRPHPPVEAWRTHDWERLWLAIQNRPWGALALVPAGRGSSKSFTLDVAVALARTGMVHLGRQIHVADGTNLSLQSNAQFIAQVRATMQSGPVILALAPTAENPVTVPLARSADFAVLCAKVGEMRVGDAKKTIQAVGKQKFLGSAAFH